MQSIKLTPRWKRWCAVLLLSCALGYVLLHVSAEVRGARLTYVEGDPERLKAALAVYPVQADVHRRLGAVYLSDPWRFDPAQAVSHYEMAVRLEPFTWSAWLNLGYGYEQQGDAERAERAYLTGVELAPRYFYPRWLYGNFLLRHGAIERSFDQLQYAADIRPWAVGSICSMIWQITGGQPDAVVQFSSRLKSGQARASVCQYLLTQQAYQPAVAVWSAIEETDPARMTASRWLLSTLRGAGQWSLARQVWEEVVRKQVGGKADASSAEWALWDGGFEHETSLGAFEWSLTSTQDVSVVRDQSERFEGSRSLRLEFLRHQKVNFNGVSQDLWVKPSTQYRLQFYYRTEKLPEVNGLLIALSDAQEPTRFNMESAPLGNPQQWTNQHIQFTTPAGTQVLRLHILRRPVQQLYDFIRGKVWFDAFRLEEVKYENKDKGND
ncbi:MAG: hypothetical protein RMM98_06905 [Acidobacteriota bacterium]|nr:hypothetical protein [Blastocatellia bacterium]MDW8239325.1 hypothetical protein [Acidobacteriota bacterium]